MMKQNKSKTNTKEPLLVKDSSVHGLGLFANKFFAAGTLIGVFEVFVTEENDIHVLWIEDDHGWTGLNVTNNLKYANHSKKPNSYLEKTSMYALVDILEGDEIFFDYGDEWE